MVIAKVFDERHFSFGDYDILESQYRLKEYGADASGNIGPIGRVGTFKEKHTNIFGPKIFVVPRSKDSKLRQIIEREAPSHANAFIIGDSFGIKIGLTMGNLIHDRPSISSEYIK